LTRYSAVEFERKAEPRHGVRIAVRSVIESLFMDFRIRERSAIVQDVICACSGGCVKVDKAKGPRRGPLLT